jgi:hypothetical protein
MDKSINSKTIPESLVASVSSCLLYPDKLKLQNEYLVKYGEEFLKLNNLKIGDEIEIEFPYEGISQKYKSREMEKFSYSKKMKGVLKLDERGRLFAESIEDMQFYNYTSNGFSGRSRKSWYQSISKKSAVFFGTGFVF